MLPHVFVSLKLINIWAAVALLALSEDGEPAGSKLTRQQEKSSSLPDSTQWTRLISLCSCWCLIKEGLETRDWGQKKRSETPTIWAEIGLSCCETAAMAFQVILNDLAVSVLRYLAMKLWIVYYFFLSLCNFWANISSSEIVLKILSSILFVSIWSPRHILTVCPSTFIWKPDYVWGTQAYPHNLPAENITKCKI